MINKLIDSIAVTLNREFGDAYEIYTEDIEQGLTEPCFLIICVSPKSELFRGYRYYRENLFMVQYFPKGPDFRNESMAVLERLYLALESVRVDGRPIFGSSMEGEYIDEVLHFQVGYNGFMDKAEDGDQMETLTQQIELKG